MCCECQNYVKCNEGIESVSVVSAKIMLSAMRGSESVSVVSA